MSAVENLGACSCGKPFEGIYSAFVGECRECERFREAESILAAQMLEHGFPRQEQAA